MNDEQRYLLLIARMLDLLRSKPGAVDETKEVLRSLWEMTTRRSWTVRLKGSDIFVEGLATATSTPPMPVLAEQMRTHNISEMHVAQGVSAKSLMYLLRALAAQQGAHGGAGIDDLLKNAGVKRIHVLNDEQDAEVDRGTPQRVTDAMRVAGGEEQDESESDTGKVIERADAMVPSAPPPSIDELIEQIRSDRISLGVAAKKLRGLKAGAQLTSGLDALAGGVVKAVKSNRLEEAIEAILAVINQEKEAAKEDVRICCGVALRRLLGTEILRNFSPLLLDDLYVEDVLTILGRAGSNATQLLLDQLVTAPTFAERRAFMTALRRLGEGTGNVISMLNHHQWYVVRNVADLLAELRIEESVPELGKVANHADARVRKSVAVALARIGTPAAARHLHLSLRDEDRDVRFTVAGELKGAGLSGLVMPIVNELEREEDAEIRQELCRALGRIGTPEAVRTLENVAQRKGTMFTQQRPSGDRRAAVEGLALAGGDVARQALRSLVKDRDKDVRNAVQAALASMGSGSG